MDARPTSGIPAAHGYLTARYNRCVVVPRYLSVGIGAVPVGFVGFYVAEDQQQLEALIGAVFRGVEQNDILEVPVHGGADMAGRFTKSRIHRSTGA